MEHVLKSEPFNLQPCQPVGQSEVGVPLAQLRSGDMAVVCRLNGGEEFRSKMLSLGLIPGKQINVYRSDKYLPFILEVDQSRIMVDHRALDHIYVQSVTNRERRDRR